MPLAVIARVASLSEAHVIVGALRWVGITADVRDANLGQTDWLYQNALGGFRVVIPSDSMADATDMLRELRAQAIPADEDSWRPVLPVGKRRLAALMLFLFA